MEPPEKPDDSDCCNSGCSPCILDVYQTQLELYNKRNETSQTRRRSKPAILPTKYSEFKTITIDNVCQDHLLITFQSDLIDSCLDFEAGQHFLLKGPSFQGGYTTRPYTPLKYFDETPHCFVIIIKIYEGGVLSHYLKNLKLGDKTSWRGPYGDYRYECNRNKNILMIAQGTGIAPLYSIAEEILRNEEDESVIKMICCFKSDAFLLRNKLYEMKSFWNFSYEIYTDLSVSDKKYGEIIKYKKLENEDVIQSIGNKSNSTRLLICGSENFSQHYKTVAIQCGVKENDVFTF